MENHAPYLQDDMVIHALQQNILNFSNLNFRMLRTYAGIDAGQHARLDRGRLTIHCQDLLNQYLWSYGPMVARQWYHVLARISNILDQILRQTVHIIDYGCGQGLALLLVFDKMIGLHHAVQTVTLIEPSNIALQRACYLLSCKLPKTQIYAVNKKLDDVAQSELRMDCSSIYMHVFSNILDIDGFDPFSLLHKLLAFGGIHYFLAVSNDRCCYGGSIRLETAFDALIHLAQDEGQIIKISQTQFERFKDVRNMHHIYFFLKVEIQPYE